MWIVVDYSKKSVKSNYFGVIICFGGEDSKKLGYSLNKMQNTLSIDRKTQIFGILLKNYTVLAFYMQNTLKTWDI